MRRVLLSWSSGKDSAWALHLLRQQPDVEVVGLVTSFNQAFDRVAMHAVRRELVELQAERVGLPLWAVELPWPCSNAEYEARMGAVWERAQTEGVGAVAFGDLFLEDIRAYRVKQLAGTGLKPLFPVWGLATDELAREMVNAGVEARVTCVDPKYLPREFAGTRFDREFLRSLPEGVDPCGEKGEFHTFVSASPVFHEPLRVEVGEVVERDGFVFADVKETHG